MVLNFGTRLAQAVKQVGVPLALGLDPHLDRLPDFLRQQWSGLTGRAMRAKAADAIVTFNSAAIRAAEGKVAAVKPQFAFYEQLGSAGMAALEETCRLAREANLLIIGDAKRGDISSTAAAYARAIISPDGPFACDAVTLNPWMGVDTLAPFLPYCQESGRGLFVLLRTTNPGAALLQQHGSPPASELLATQLASMGKAEEEWSSIGAVVGAMTPDDAKNLRHQMPQSWFLVPGVGAQGGSLNAALAGARSNGLGSLVVCSRALLFPSEPNPMFESRPEDFIRQQIDDLRAKFDDNIA